MRGRKGEGEEREGMGQVVRGLMSHRRTWAFNPREVRALEGCGQKRDKVHVTSELGNMLSHKQYLSFRL